jgi:uncharacterized protein
MTDRKPRPGKFVWFEHVSNDPKRAQAFFAEVLDWKVESFPMGAASYDMIKTGASMDSMIGGYGKPPKTGERPHWSSYVSVADVDASAKAAAANGGKIIEPPFEMGEVGRAARIADPLGAELYVFRNKTGDPPDVETAPLGTFFWNELHTPEPERVLPFYEKVVGFTHRAMSMGDAGTYHIISGSGGDRGGVTHHLPPGMPAHWLPYVHVEDPDATLERARKHGATVRMDALDIPGVGRFGVFDDPTGALLAVMKPKPPERKA